LVQVSRHDSVEKTDLAAPVAWDQVPVGAKDEGRVCVPELRRNEVHPKHALAE